jgi:acyl dehydratase
MKVKGDGMSQNKTFWGNVKKGDTLPTFSKLITATSIIYGALATRDFIPLHHDHSFAQSQGMQDIFMNYLTIGGWASKYLTDWTGQTGILKRISFNIGMPCFPGDTVTWNGKVTEKANHDGQPTLEVEFIADVERGTNCTGNATLILTR